MKKTSVVQGLKSLADKIHPNGHAPLTASESKRLLTALTSSFRRHLDAAHPATLEDDKRKSAERQSVPQINIDGIHSSAVFAQKHMASVLTNPLLMKGGKDYTSAKVELAKNSHKDPIELLEEYEKEGVATVRVAELCLEHVHKEYVYASEARKPKILGGIQPGRRVFLWLLQSGHYLSETYVDNLPFIDLLVYFLTLERRQKELWQWLHLDFRAPTPREGAPQSAMHSTNKRMLYDFRWRGRVLSAMVQHTVGISRHPIPDKTQLLHARSLDSALDILFRAVELQSSAPKSGAVEHWHHLTWIPLGHAMTFLVKLLTRRLLPANYMGDVKVVDGDSIDVVRYDKLVECVPLASDLGEEERQPDKFKAALRLSNAAMLQLAHPSAPVAEPMLSVLRTLLPDDRARSHPKFLGSLDHHYSLRTAWGTSAIRCASILAANGKYEDATWARARVPLYMPKLAQVLERSERHFTMSRSHHANEPRPEELSEPARIPFPGFA